MKIKPFAIERYFARYEFSAPYLLSCSDCESLPLKELLALADAESLRLWEGLSLGYTESQGLPALRAEIARLYTGISPQEALVLAPEEGIFIAMNTILEPGDHVIVTFPAYQSLYEIAAACGCDISPWMPHEGSEWSFDLDSLRALVKPNTRLIVVNFPHNPTGSLISRDDFRELCALASERGITLFSDEMYRFLEYDPADRLDSACELVENAVSLCGMSKSLSLPGLRIGWLVTRHAGLYARMATFKDYTTICSSAPSEVLALMALRAKDAILRRNLDIIRRNLEVLERFFAANRQTFAWIKPKCGPIAFPRLLGEHPVADLCTDLVEKKGVMLLPETVFDYRGNHFRLGFGRRNMPEALDRLVEYLAEHPIPA